MNTRNLAILGAVVVVATAIVFLKQEKKGEPVEKGAAPVTAHVTGLPRLVDLGAGKCIPCKAMKPILEDLAANYADAFKTEFIDVWEDEGAKDQYAINLIPTQIFFAADGKELYRHEGFFAKEDILAKWKELGVCVAREEMNAQRSTPNAQR